MSHLFDKSGLKKSRAKTTDPTIRALVKLQAAKQKKGVTRLKSLEELGKFLADKGLSPEGVKAGQRLLAPSQPQTTTQPRPAQSAGAGGAAPTTSLTRAGVPTSQLGTLFGSPLNIPARVGQALTGRQLTGGLFDILGAGRAAGISFPSATIFRRLSPSERRAAQDAARLKGLSPEEFQAGILRSSPGDRPRPSIRSRPRRSRVAIP